MGTARINDINDSAEFTNVSFPAWYDTLVTKWFESVELVYNRGYRNFLFVRLEQVSDVKRN